MASCTLARSLLESFFAARKTRGVNSISKEGMQAAFVGLEFAGFALAGNFGLAAFGEAIEFRLANAIFASGVVGGFDLYGPQRNDDVAVDDADVLSLPGLAQPETQFLASLGNGECRHN